MEVFGLITKGLSNAEIGQELFISDTTVKTHVTRLLQKLDLRDRAQAIVLAYQTGLFGPPTRPTCHWSPRRRPVTSGRPMAVTLSLPVDRCHFRSHPDLSVLSSGVQKVTGRPKSGDRK